MRHCPESLNIPIDRLSNIGYNKGGITSGDAPNNWRKTGGGYDRNFYPLGCGQLPAYRGGCPSLSGSLRRDDPGDGSLIRAALQDIARSGNMSRLAREVGMSREGLYKALSEKGNPSFAAVMQITRALGMQLRITA